VLCLSSSPPADIIADADKENGDRKSPPSSRGVIQQIRVSENVWTLSLPHTNLPATVTGVFVIHC